MNKKILLTLAVAGAVGAGFAAKKDPAVMRVAGRDVPRSEFEYLYNKNAGQQVEQQSLDEYAELFKIYKLKVADALANHLDTSAAFRKEFNGYKSDLARPYMIDSAYYHKLMQEIYKRDSQEVEAKHIMIFKPREFGGMISGPSYTLIDSLLTELRAGADFAEMARKYSQDRASASNGGSMGYITAAATPYDFETAVYTLREGELSGIVESPYALHIIQGGKHRKARGEVEASHILKMVPADATEAEQARIKAEVDSLYQLAIQPDASFEALAAANSDDRGSARNGGYLGWFGTGRMVPEFDSVAFAIPVGAISEPVKSRFGYHIIKKKDAKPFGSFKDNEPKYRQVLDNPQGPYGSKLYSEFSGKLRKKYHFKEDAKLLQAIKASAANGINTEFIDKWKDNNQVLASWDGVTYTAAQFANYLAQFAPEKNPKAAPGWLQKRFDNYVNQEMHKLQLANLADENEAYRNLLGEYRDGMLLFEISNQKVWEKAAKDSVGLEEFFLKNRSDYTWQTPHVKGILVQAPDDAVATQVQTYMASLANPDQAIDSVRTQFPMVKIDEVFVAKGDNALVDALMFGSQPVQNPDSKYPFYFLTNARVITEPETAADVRGQVTADYQNELERLWIEELMQKYPVETYPAELKKVKAVTRK